MNDQGVLFADSPFGWRPAHRPPPAQASSPTSVAAAASVEKSRKTVADFIERALREVGLHGMTPEELARRVTQLRGTPTKEQSILGRIAGTNVPPEMDDRVCKSGRTRRNESGREADVYVLRKSQV